jgi:3-phenylpropionate/trans-cinnamate dioxygenase ferredoxin reductase subunit
VITDVEVAVEEVPEVTTVNGCVTALQSVAPDVVELCISLHEQLDYLPGQYLQVQFRG